VNEDDAALVPTDGREDSEDAEARRRAEGWLRRLLEEGERAGPGLIERPPGSPTDNQAILGKAPADPGLPSACDGRAAMGLPSQADGRPGPH
jgi:hypothetical protein